VPGGDDVGAFERLLERSLLVVPGSYLGHGGEGHLRVSLTPAPEQIAAAAALLATGVGTDLTATAG
jgi:aspartate/methionine/tyrosine aminotransferase